MSTANGYGDEVMRYRDARFNTIAAKLLPTQYLVVDDDTALTTTLGSCVAACIRDPVLKIGGMNHFLLPDGTVGDEELDALLQAVASEPTTAEREAASAAAQQYLAEQAYILPIFEEPQVFGLTDKVQGFATESVGRPLFYATWLAG